MISDNDGDKNNCHAFLININIDYVLAKTIIYIVCILYEYTGDSWKNQNTSGKGQNN